MAHDSELVSLALAEGWSIERIQRTRPSDLHNLFGDKRQRVDGEGDDNEARDVSPAVVRNEGLEEEVSGGKGSRGILQFLTGGRLFGKSPCTEKTQKSTTSGEGIDFTHHQRRERERRRPSLCNDRSEPDDEGSNVDEEEEQQRQQSSDAEGEEDDEQAPASFTTTGGRWSPAGNFGVCVPNAANTLGEHTPEFASFFSTTHSSSNPFNGGFGVVETPQFLHRSDDLRHHSPPDMKRRDQNQRGGGKGRARRSSVFPRSSAERVRGQGAPDSGTTISKSDAILHAKYVELTNAFSKEVEELGRRLELVRDFGHCLPEEHRLFVRKSIQTNTAFLDSTLRELRSLAEYSQSELKQRRRVAEAVRRAYKDRTGDDINQFWRHKVFQMENVLSILNQAEESWQETISAIRQHQ